MMLIISTITIQRISKMITVIEKMNSAFLNLHVINLKSKLANALEVCSSICFKEVQWGALKAIHSQMSICHSWEKYYCNVSVGIFHRLWNWYSVLQIFLQYTKSFLKQILATLCYISHNHKAWNYKYCHYSK